MPERHDGSPESGSHREEYTCLACGKTAYPTGEGVDTLDPDAAHIQFLDDSDDEVTICFECLQTDDWEERARTRRSNDDTDPTVPEAVSADGWFKNLWKQIRTLLDTDSEQETVDNQTPEGGPNLRGESGATRSEKEKLEWKLEQEREWSTYLERELQAKEDRLREVEQELHQLRQESNGDGPGEATISPHSPLLSTIFDVREALANATAQADPDSGFRDGLVRIDQQLADALEQQGIQRIDTSGEANPHRHKVIETIATTDHPPGTILEEYQAGYQRGGVVLRPAQVAVAAEPRDDSERGAGDDYAGDESR